MSLFFLKNGISCRNLVGFCLNVPYSHKIFLERIQICSHGNTVPDADGHVQNIVKQRVVLTIGNRGVDGALILISSDHIVGIVRRMLDHIKTGLQIFTVGFQVFLGKIVS